MLAESLGISYELERDEEMDKMEEPQDQQGEEEVTSHDVSWIEYFSVTTINSQSKS